MSRYMLSYCNTSANIAYMLNIAYFLCPKSMPKLLVSNLPSLNKTISVIKAVFLSINRSQKDKEKEVYNKTNILSIWYDHGAKSRTQSNGGACL